MLLTARTSTIKPRAAHAVAVRLVAVLVRRAP
jgi:hypothetical protein